MAKNKTKTKEDVSKIIDQYKRAWDYNQPVRDIARKAEKVVYGSLNDSITDNTRSQVNDPRLLTIMMERSFRVMSQLATGKVRTLTRKDKGKGQFMGLVLHNYVEPNAKSQWDILTKLRMVNFYSNVYGTIGVLVDYVITDDYVGPDFQIIPFRDLVQQPGKISVEDCDYVFIKTKVTRSYLKSLRGRGSWNSDAIDKLLGVTEGTKSNIDDADIEEQTWGEEKYGGDFTAEGDYAEIDLVTKYERDTWTTVSLRHAELPPLRTIDNPHKNHEIPVKIKTSFPLLDRFAGLGEVERGLPLQNAINSLINLYLDGVKFSIFPPTKIDLTKVVPSTIKMQPGAKWVVKDMGGVQSHVVSPQGINTFQETYKFFIAALMNQSGTTNTSVSESTDVSMGKTPRALAMQENRQNARDSFDRFMMERFVEQVYDTFLDLIVTKQEKPITVTLFEEELETIVNNHPDAVDLFDSGEGGEIIIKPEDIKDCDYKFYIDAGSTYKKDEYAEGETLQNLMAMLMQLPNAANQIMQTGNIQIGGRVVDFGEMLKRFIISRGVQDWDKIIKDSAEVGGAIGFDDEQLNAIYQELQGQQPGTPPQQEVPTQGMPPGGMM
jgi:hypothetical protein